MEADQGTLGQAIAGITVLLVGGFIAYKVIQALAAFVDALQREPDSPSKDESEENAQSEQGGQEPKRR